MSGLKSVLMAVLVAFACAGVGYAFGTTAMRGVESFLFGGALYWFFRHWGDRPSTPV